MKKKISVVVPVYFNEGSLEKLFKELLILEKELIKKNFLLELIFVDDGSGDNSLEKLLEFKTKRNNTKVIKLTRNFGANLACKEGLRHSTGDCFTTLAADLQDPPNLILKMIERWESGSKFVVCVRESREDFLFKIIFARLFYVLIRKFVISHYPKYGYDMSLLDRSILTHIINSSKSMYYQVHLYWLGYKPDIIFYKRIKRKAGKSRWTIYKNINATLDVLLGFSSKFTQLISIFGLIISATSFLYGIKLIFGAISGNIPVPGYASIVVLMSFFFGLIILYLSLIQEYLWRIYGEINKRSEVIVDEIFN